MCGKAARIAHQVPQVPISSVRLSISSVLCSSRILGESCEALLTNMSRPPNSLTARRSEEHTSELQSLMRISYAVFFLQKQNELRGYCASTATTSNLSAIPYPSATLTYSALPLQRVHTIHYLTF